ncbi:hypothetical protein KCU90_g104, partial [Aureobasidium melanogenum]
MKIHAIDQQQHVAKVRLRPNLSRGHPHASAPTSCPTAFPIPKPARQEGRPEDSLRIELDAFPETKFVFGLCDMIDSIKDGAKLLLDNLVRLHVGFYVEGRHDCRANAFDFVLFIRNRDYGSTSYNYRGEITRTQRPSGALFVLIGISDRSSQWSRDRREPSYQSFEGTWGACSRSRDSMKRHCSVVTLLPYNTYEDTVTSIPTWPLIRKQPCIGLLFGNWCNFTLS